MENFEDIVAKRSLDRRSFLGIAGALAAGTLASALALPAKAAASGQKLMSGRRKLGTLEVSNVGLGVQPEEKKVLIVYLSRTNNTKAIAEMIQQNVGGTLVALELQTPYSADYRATVQQVVHENETGFLPPLKSKIEGIEQYDVVFVGFPTWDMQLPPPIKTFVHQYDLKGKTMIPFNTNGGYGPGSTFQTVRELCPQSTILHRFTIRGGSERDGEFLAIKGATAGEAKQKVWNWLTAIRMLK